MNLNSRLAVFLLVFLGIAYQGAYGKTEMVKTPTPTPSLEGPVQYKVTDSGEGDVWYEVRLRQGNVISIFFQEALVGTVTRLQEGRIVIFDNFESPVLVTETYDRPPLTLRDGEQAQGRIYFTQKEDSKVMEEATITQTASTIGRRKILTHVITYAKIGKHPTVIVETFRNNTTLPMVVERTKITDSELPSRRTYIQVDEEGEEVLQ